MISTRRLAASIALAASAALAGCGTTPAPAPAASRVVSVVEKDQTVGTSGGWTVRTFVDGHAEYSATSTPPCHGLARTDARSCTAANGTTIPVVTPR